MSEINFPIQKLKSKIYLIRGFQVMLDYDLAILYGVETKILNQSVRRNASRFPDDFMFQLTEIEESSLRSQIVTSKIGRGGRRYRIFAFTELGIAMISSVLKSEKAIQVNIAIMRMFFELRKMMKYDDKLTTKFAELEKNTSQLFQLIFNRLDTLEVKATLLPPSRRKIGI